MKPFKYDLHVFDLDDTLVNTKEAYWYAQTAAIRDVYPEVPQEKLEALTPVLKWLCAIFGSSKVEEYFSAFLKMTSEIFHYSKGNHEKVVMKYHSHFKEKFSCFEYVKLYLGQLQESGKKLAIVSNGGIEQQISKLETAGLESFFSKNNIFISGQFPKHLEKPSPHMLNEACNRIGVSTEKTVFYGNSDVDILAGNLAGITTSHFARTTDISLELEAFAAPNFTFSDWSELLSF